MSWSHGGQNYQSFQGKGIIPASLLACKGKAACNNAERGPPRLVNTKMVHEGKLMLLFSGLVHLWFGLGSVSNYFVVGKMSGGKISPRSQEPYDMLSNGAVATYVFKPTFGKYITDKAWEMIFLIT